MVAGLWAGCKLASKQSHGLPWLRRRLLLCKIPQLWVPMCGRGGLMSWWKGNSSGAAAESPSPDYAAPTASPFAPEHNAEENYPTTSGGASPALCTAALQHTCNGAGCHEG